MTNIEKIRAMSAEELAGWLYHISLIYHKEDLKRWLESEVEE